MPLSSANTSSAAWKPSASAPVSGPEMLTPSPLPPPSEPVSPSSSSSAHAAATSRSASTPTSNDDLRLR